MIGRVEGNEARLWLTVVGRDERTFDADAVIDTGFTGYLTLPPAVVRAGAFPLVGSEDVILADGTTVPLDLYRAIVVWDGQRRTVFVFQADAGPLVGMSLLRGHRVVLHVVDGGDVTVDSWT
jgi:clan AA aspartic protease